jgi:hypothetical protein
MKRTKALGIIAADALVLAARVVRETGFDERALDTMFEDNPARLLGLSVSNTERGR